MPARFEEHLVASVPHFAWVARLGTGLNVWSGDTDVTIEGVDYQAGIGLSLSDITEEEGVPAKRARVSFGVANPNLRRELLNDPGPVRVEMRWIASHDQGATWEFLPLRFVGRLSKPAMRDGIYTIELERYVGTVDRGAPRRWSHEQQQVRTHGVDKGFEFVRGLSQGKEIRWPP